MAIVIKEASKTPLALGQLAETMANTYLQHNKMKYDFKIAEQDSIWKNTQQQAQLDAANAINDMDDNAFALGAAGKKLAYADSINGKAVGNYFAGGGSSPEWMQKKDALTAMYNEQNRLASLGQEASPEQQASWRSLIEVVNPYDYRQDPTGMEGHFQSEGLAGIGQDSVIGSIGVNGEYTAGNVNLGNVANNAQSSEPASMTGSIPTITNQAEYDALPNGARYIHNGIPRTKGL